MSVNDRRDRALAAEYALGTLRGAARLRFQRRLKREPALEAETARWVTLLHGMESQLQPVTPPEAVWKKIALALPERKPAPVYGRTLPWLTAAGLVFAVLLYAFAFRPPALTPLTVLNGGQQSGQWIVSANGARDRIRLSPVEVMAVAPDKSLELWVIPAGQAPVSLGVIQGGSVNNIDITRRLSMENAVLAVSLEPKGGSKTGQPTGPVLYSAKL
ncbi:hypothetical protein PANPA_00256 (plasmid) [Pantoea sp. Nvir]|uniref:anti-sigma factor n=1 Tax=Pantoea sp. Nvir TaxID=2576760 RepID=UPI0030D50BC4